MRKRFESYESDNDPIYTSDGARVLGRVVLPSGKGVELVSYMPKDRDSPQQEAASGNCVHKRPLAYCPVCGHDRVQPTGWSTVGSSHWHVNLRCPDCEELREGIFEQDELDEYDAALDEGTRSVAEDLDLLARANMADDIDNFVKALDKGHIWPEDF